MSTEPELPESWSPAERWAWEEIRAGRTADFHQRHGQPLDPGEPDGWDDRKKDRRLSSAFLVTIVTDERFRRVTPFRGVRIQGALFEEAIDLQHARLERQLWLEQCRFLGNLSLMNLHVNGWFSLEGSWIGETAVLNGAVLDSAVSLAQATFLGEVDLTGAKIGFQLSMSGSTFDAKLDMNGVEVGQNLQMNKQASFQEVELTGARIGGQLELSGSAFNAKLDMNGITVGQHLQMHQQASFEEVEMTAARIGGQLDMSNSTFNGRLSMDGVEIGESVYARFATFAEEHDIALHFAKIGSTLDLSGSTLGAIDLTATTITGELRLGSGQGHKPTQWVGPSKMILRNTTVNAIQDAGSDTDSWPRDLELEGFSYGRLGGFGAVGPADFANRESAWFIKWLERDRTFSPQPYEQLARVLRESGYPAKATAVLYASRQRTRRAAWMQLEGKPREPLRWFGMMLLESTIGYGLGARYFRVLWWFAGLTLLGFVVLLASIEQPDWDLFKMVWASFDKALPIVSLNDEHEKYILENCGAWAKSYFYIQSIAGYVLGGFLAAGVAGLTQKS